MEPRFLIYYNYWGCWLDDQRIEGRSPLEAQIVSSAYRLCRVLCPLTFLRGGLDGKDLERNKSHFATGVRVEDPLARSESPPPVPVVYCTYRN